MSGINNKLLIGIVVLVVVAIGAYAALRVIKKVSTTMTAPAQTSTVPTQNDTSSDMASSPSASMSQTTVTISASGFTPQTVTIKARDSVTWTNSDSTNHTVNSDPHPSHTLYPILNQVGRMAASDKKSLAFPTAGKFTYHDHLNPQFTGTVIVQ